MRAWDAHGWTLRFRAWGPGSQRRPPFFLMRHLPEFFAWRWLQGNLPALLWSVLWRPEVERLFTVEEEEELGIERHVFGLSLPTMPRQTLVFELTMVQLLAEDDAGAQSPVVSSGEEEDLHAPFGDD